MEQCRQSAVTAGELLSASRRARGHLWRRAGEEKDVSWLPLASWPSYIACAVAIRLLSLPLFSRRRRRSSVELSPSI